MRLKTYIAPTVAEGIALVRESLGDTSLIVATERLSGGRGIRLTAAVEETWPGEPPPDAGDGEAADTAAAVRDALSFHGAPPFLVDRLVRAAAALDAEEPELAFAGALDADFRFEPLANGIGGRSVVLVGPPGVGKTITVAKLAARDAMAGHDVAVISTDTRRAGGVDQLAAFTRILGLDLATAETPLQLRRAVKAAGAVDSLYIDTAGANPFSDEELAALRERIEAAGAEPVLVLAAGCDAREAADTAVAFAALGAKRLIATRVDVARRLGGILAAADGGRMALAAVSVTPHVAEGLCTINPVSLSRLLLPRAPDPEQPTTAR